MRVTMFRNVAEPYKVNFKRDYKVYVYAGVKLGLPFADLRLIDFGLTLPHHMKLSVDKESPKKLMLSLVRKIGFPKTVT